MTIEIKSCSVAHSHGLKGKIPVCFCLYIDVHLLSARDVKLIELCQDGTALSFNAARPRIDSVVRLGEVQCVHSSQGHQIQISPSNFPSVEKKILLEKKEKTWNFCHIFLSTGFPTSAAFNG